MESNETGYLEVSQDAGRLFVTRQIEGDVVMLNLLRFRELADYSSAPELAPDSPITGEQAYRRYMAVTQPFLERAGGELLFIGEGDANLIGPSDERWDLVMLVRHQSVETFLSFASNEEYQVGLGHRIAALEDSRLLPIIQGGEQGPRTP